MLGWEKIKEIPSINVSKSILGEVRLGLWHISPCPWIDWH